MAAAPLLPSPSHPVMVDCTNQEGPRRLAGIAPRCLTRRLANSIGHRSLPVPMTRPAARIRPPIAVDAHPDASFRAATRAKGPQAQLAVGGVEGHLLVVGADRAKRIGRSRRVRVAVVVAAGAHTAVTEARHARSRTRDHPDPVSCPPPTSPARAQTPVKISDQRHPRRSNS